jgi:hypothetical protein
MPLLVLVSWILLLSGCQSSVLPRIGASPKPESASLTDTPGSPPTLDAGWTLHGDNAQGYAIAFPDTWDFVYRDSPTYDADVAAVIAAGAELGKFFTDGFKTGQPGGIALIAAEPRSAQSGFVTNLSVFKMDLGPAAGAPPLDSIVKAKTDVVTKAGNTSEIRTQQVNLPAGSARQVLYTAKSDKYTAVVGYYLATVDRGGHRYLVEIVIGSTVSDATTLFGKIAKSFRLITPAPSPSASSQPGPRPPSATP